MKRDMDSLNLRDAFPPMPDACRAALITAARSVKEEKDMKRATIRIALIAACIILATMTAAIAASRVFGWADFYGHDDNIQVPDAAQKIMADSQPEEFTLGPVIFTVQERYADRHTAMASVVTRLADGQAGILCGDDPWGYIAANDGETGAAYLKQLGLDHDVTWIEAARQLSLPLYSVEGCLDGPAEYYDGESMYDVMLNEDGSLTVFSLALLNGQAAGDALTCGMYLRVWKINPDDPMDESGITQEEISLSIPLQAALDQCVYTFDGPYTAYGLTLENVEAELTPAGLYLFTDFIAREGMTRDEFYENGQYVPVWTLPDGTSTSFGLSLSYVIDTDAWPQVRMMGMVSLASLDSLPDTLTLALEDDNAPAGAAPAPRMTLTK